ncbi:MAG: SPASM domain-containing protein [Phycisphaeraceae bacterium]|nr:MAG: SPASM domain-containing protein [Phycisphaeraceae bacterium]
METRGVATGLTVNERAYQARVQEAAAGVYVDYPMRVGVETYAVCNAACDFCPYPTMERKGDRMDDATLAKILDDLEEIPSEVEFGLNPSRVSEPLLDTRIFTFLEELNKRFSNAGIILFTNASALNGRNLDRVMALERYQLFNVSFNDHRKAEYERVMQLDFDRTTRNLDRLHGAVQAAEFPVRPRISRVGDGTDADQGFCDWVRDRWPGFEPMVSPRMDWMGRVACSFSTLIPDVPCMQWFTIQLLANGRDAFCCTDHDAAYGYGSIHESSLLELYNHPERRELRLQTPSRHGMTPCGTCPLLA